MSRQDSGTASRGEPGVGDTSPSLPPSASRLPTPDYVAYSGLIIDDIVLPDGRTYFNTLGGSGTHALIGMRLWSERLGYFAAIGSDFSSEHRAQLEGLGVDLRGLLEREGFATPRAWQLFEPDERRIEVFRTKMEDFYAMEARPEEMPDAYLRARGYQVHYGGLAQTTELVEMLRAANPGACLVWEPTPVQATGMEEAFRGILGRIDAVTPDRDEAGAMTGEVSPQGMIERLLGWGVPMVALRMGAQGSLIGSAAGEVLSVPAVPTTVVDTTGAGDAYCGGLLVALSEGHDLAEAGARAAVSASFAIEQFGVPVFDERTPAAVARRLAWARERVSRVAG